jgi:hypothetical protein
MDRWQQIESICQSALELEEIQRASFLEEACGGDEELRREVESLLQFDGRGEQFIKEPALEVAAKMIAQDMPESLLGQQLGSYEILSLLGAGGMGVVYKARDTRLKRSVAFKVLPADQMSDPGRRSKFIQEARAASALNHPNIITIHDVGSERGIDFVVMEYVAGKTLDQVLSSVIFRAFSPVNEGLYFIPAPGTDRKSSIQFLSFATAKVKSVAPMSGPPVEGLSVSPDGRFLLFSQRDVAGSDLMLVENFR